MVKNLFLVLASVVLIFCAVSPAMANDEVITFAGIPWGSSVEEALQKLIDDGYLTEETPVDEFIKGSLENRESSAALYLTRDEKVIADRKQMRGEQYKSASLIVPTPSGSSISLSDYLTGKQIDGCEVRGISLDFAYDQDGTKLVMVLVHLEHPDSIDEYYDAQKRMEEKYGEYASLEGAGRNYEDNKSVWFGADNTCLIEYYMLYHSEKFGDSQDMDLMYGTLDGEEMYKEAYSRLK